MTQRAGVHENSKDEYGTPESFFESDNAAKPGLMEAVGGSFDLDPAAGAETHKIAETTYEGPPDGKDGLEEDWFGEVWLNPPFSQKIDFMRKAFLEDALGHTEVIIMLLPECTADGWFHEYVIETDLVCFVDGRMSFDGGGDSPAGGIQLAVLFGDDCNDYKRRAIRRALEEKGPVWEP